MHFGPPARLLLCLCLLALAGIAPPLAASGAETNELVPVADGWVNAARPGKNHGTESVLKNYGGVWETYIRFDLTPWRGRAFGTLHLELSAVVGDGASLSATSTATSWQETTLDYNRRPAQVSETAVPAEASGETAAFDLAELFPARKIDIDAISLRLATSMASVVRFGSRESSTPPRLVLSSRVTTEPAPLTPYEDVHASASTPTSNYASTPSLVVDADPQTETYMSFDLAEWSTERIAGVHLRLWLKDEAGAGLSVYRIGSGWNETEVTWEARPTGTSLLSTTSGRTAPGAALLDVSAAFPDHVIDRRVLSLRLATTSANGFVTWSREGAVPPQLLITTGSGTDPTPGPTQTASTTPTKTPSSTPSPTPTPSPIPSPTPSPTPTPTPSTEQQWLFHGFGTDHGVGMSQYGARGRANAGQPYDEILAHYYTGTTLGTINRNQVVRVQLATSYRPTQNLPARITARGGGWSSSAFMDGGSPRAFPADSYAQMTPADGGWALTVHGAEGDLLASAATTDVTMTGSSAETLFEMKWRDSLIKYDLYRGRMRMLVNGDGVQAINHVDMDDYLKGVVPAEMPPLWPIEAVKVQAVAARGYAYARLKPNSVFDVQPTADNQVYGGVRLEHPRSNQAVDVTSNQVVMANGVTANTYFFTVGGGHTENNELAWVSNAGKIVSSPISYLRGVPDLDENGLAYDRSAGSYEWSSDAFTWTQLQQMLAADSRTNVGTLLDLRFERGVSGRIYRVTIIGNQRTVYVSGQLLKGVYNNHRLSGGTLKSSMLYLERAP